MAAPTAPATDVPQQTLAALDLGSNSFHLIVALDQGERLQVVDKHREMVRLAAGLNAANELTEPAQARAVACLTRLGQRLRGIPAANVRVVGTNTLRKAANGEAFIARAEAALGHRIDVIGGREEARLIYLGVSHSLEDNSDWRLVVDIGGGSTELILGRRFQPRLTESLQMGCAALSAAHFGDGRINAKRLAAAQRAAGQELEVIERIYRARGWNHAIGASGTALAIHGVIEAELGGREITRAGLTHLERRLIEAGHLERLDFAAVSRERAPVFPGGVAILAAIFESLGLERMSVSDGALREGLLHDLLGRVHDEDIREKTVRDVARRYHVDREHAARVAQTAQNLLEQLRHPWRMDDPELSAALKWAAALHEIGLDIAHSQYHKHGGYLLDNMDLPGFSRSEQHRVALLVRAHRRKFPAPVFAGAEHLARLCALLRIAVVLHRSRAEGPLPPFSVTPVAEGVRLSLPKKWLRAHPLTELDLEQEAAYLAQAPVRLQVSAR